MKTATGDKEPRGYQDMESLSAECAKANSERVAMWWRLQAWKSMAVVAAIAALFWASLFGVVVARH